MVHALHRRIADAGIGAALRRDNQVERPLSLFHRDADRQLIAIRFDVLVEGLIKLDVAGRQLWLADRRRAVAGREREALPVHVVAVRNLVGNVDFAGFLSRAEFEGDGGIEEIVRSAGKRAELSENQATEQEEDSVQRMARTSIKTVKHGEGVGFQQ